MSTTTAPTTLSRVRRTGRAVKHIFDEMVTAREVGLGRRR